MKQITFKQYKSIDLALLCILTAFFEAVACLATTRWFVLQAMAVSITLAMTCISAFRWNAWALLPALVGSLTHAIVSGATPNQIAAYCGGSVFSLISILVLKRLDKEIIRKDFLKRTLFTSATYLLIACGRWLVSLAFEQNFSSIVIFITSDVLSLLFAVVVLTIAKNIDGLIEDQRSYLLRLERERIEEERANLQDPFNDPYKK